MAVSITFDVLQKTIMVAKELHTMISKMQWATEEMNRVSQRINKILDILNDVKMKKIESESIQGGLNDANQQLCACMQFCRDMNDKPKFMKFVNIHSHSAMVVQIGKRLDQVVQDLSLTLLHYVNEQISKLIDQVEELKIKVERDIIHPTAGVYPISRGTLKPPAKVKVNKPVMDIEGDQIIISWDDPNNHPSSLRGYEVRYDDTQGHNIPLAVKYKSVGLTYPRVTPGKLYTIQVRAIGKKGLGPWSEAITCFKTGPPNKPDQPMVTVDTTSVTVSILIPEPEKCNGAYIKEAIVEYCELEKSSQWISNKKLVCKNDATTSLNITGLPANTLHLFRIKLVNEFGTSQASNLVKLKTKVPIPGIATEIRKSTFYTSNLLKIRWNPPDKNSQYVGKYIVKYKKKEKEFDERHKFEVIETKKLSATSRNLKSNTTYVFYVSAHNSFGESCGDKARIEARTKWPKAAKCVLSPFVFAGATLASPLLGTVGGVVFGAILGGVAGVETEQAIYSMSNSKAGKGCGVGVGVATGVGVGTVGAVAGGLGGAVIGTVGAPVTGIAAAHTFVHAIDDYSDQSDDEVM